MSKRKKVVEIFIDYLLNQENLDLNRKEVDYGIHCLDKQIINTIKINNLNSELLRLERTINQAK